MKRHGLQTGAVSRGVRLCKNSRMFPASRNRQARRLFALTMAAVLLSLVLLAKYGSHPDTATLQILNHAVTSPVGTDSTYYMQMGERAFHSPSHLIYRDLFFTQHQKFIYPPSSLFLLRVLGAGGRLHVSSDTALMVLLVVSWIGVLALAVGLYRIESGSSSVAESACIVLLGVLFLPIAEALYRGQVQLLLTCLWGAAVLLWMRGRPGWSGFVIAVTCAFKPQLGVFLVWGLLRRKWRFTGAFVGTGFVIATASVLHYGLRNHLDYLQVLSYLGRHGEALWANQSFNGLLNRLLRNGDAMSWSLTVYPPYVPVIFVVSTALSLLMLAAALVAPWFGGWQGTAADFLLLGCSSVLISPIAWEHHYGYFFFLIVLLLARARTLTTIRWRILAACLLIMANRLPPLDHRMSGAISLVGSYLLYAGLALLVLLVLEQRPRTGLRV